MRLEKKVGQNETQPCAAARLTQMPARLHVFFRYKGIIVF